MAEENPQPVNPAVDPQAENPPSTAVPASQVDRTPAEVSSAQDPQVPPPYEENPQVTAFIEAVEADAEVRQQLAIQSLKDEAAESDLRGESRTFTESETQDDPYINRLQNQQDLAAITANQPDAAFQRAQQAKEERWQTAAAANPDGIRNDGSVSVDLGGGQRETINRDGSFAISGAEGTYRYNADGQLESYTTPTINGLSQTYTTDGVVVATYSAGPLRTEAISYNGELVSTNTTIRTGEQTLGVVQVADGPPVTSVSTVVPIEGTAGLQVTAAQVGDGEIVTSTLDLEQRRLDRLAAEEARAEAADQLRQDIIAAKQQTESGIPLGPTQLAAIAEQARELELAEAAVIQADEALAEADPTIVAPDTDPQAVEVLQQDPIPSLATIDVSPAPVTQDAEVQEFVATQDTAEFVPLSDIDTGPTPIEGANDAEVAEFETQQQEAGFVPVSAIELSPDIVTDDPEVQEILAADQAAEFVPVAEIEVDPTVVTGDDPQLPPEDQPLVVSDLVQPSSDDPQIVDGLVAAEPILYDFPEPPTDVDPVVLALNETTATDVALVDLVEDAVPVDLDFDPTLPEPIIIPGGGFFGEPPPTSPNYQASFNVETGTFDIIDADTGQVVETGLSQEDAQSTAANLNFVGDPAYPEAPEVETPTSDLIREPTDVDVAEAAFVETDGGFFELQEEAAPQPDEFGFVQADDGFFVQQDEIESQIDQTQFEDELVEFTVTPDEIEVEPEPVDSPYVDEDPDTLIDFNTGERVTAGRAQSDAAIAQAAVNNARNQQAIRDQRRNNPDSADWRVRLRLAPNATYLYNAEDPGILQPLQISDGVIFPYTPVINTVYKADYSSYNLTHSNYRGFFYQSSYTEDINITGTFTAQDTKEAEYLLAVIHFFRSATKMFYGQDAQRGAPPPLVYLSAFGQYQYVDAPCVISQFNYNLPADVDYIRARSPNQDGTNLLKKRDRQALPTNPFTAALARLRNARPGGLPTGAEQKRPPPPTLGLNSPTYVPTKMEITIMLHPMQSRKQVSQQFSLKDYASGRLQPKGFW